VRADRWSLSTWIVANAVAFSFVTGAAHGFSAGITGFSGRQQGVICNSCHAGGSAPTVDFEGPTTVEPGSTNVYRFNVRNEASGQTHAGLDISVTGGELAVDGSQGARVVTVVNPPGQEVVHNSPKAKVDGVTTWEFSWTAPPAAGSVTMFGAGNSVNRDQGSFGDRAAARTLVIDVAAAVETPTPSPTPTSDITRTPTPTLGPIPCVGDCNANGVVAVNELVTGVNIVLDRGDISECEDFDTNGSNTITVNELVSGVNALLRGCVPDL
jgi:hypothetical protein